MRWIRPRLSGLPSALTRMGQLHDDNLSKLLLTGEEEAVVAVVHAPGLTNEIARRAPGGSCPPSKTRAACWKKKTWHAATLGIVLATFWWNIYRSRERSRHHGYVRGPALVRSGQRCAENKTLGHAANNTAVLHRLSGTATGSLT